MHDIQCRSLITFSLIHKQTTNHLRFHGDTGISRGYAKVSLIHAWWGKQDFRENLYICLLLMDNLNVFNFFYDINDDFNKDITLK